MSMLLLSCPDLPEVELKLFALEDVAISATRLSRSAGNDSVESTSAELRLKKRVNFCFLLPVIKATLGVVRELFGLCGGISRMCLGSLFRYRLCVVGFIPLTEGSGIDLDDSTLDEGVRSYKLVVRCVVNNRDYPRLFGDMLRAPCKISPLETKGAKFSVSTTNTDGVYTFGAKFRVSGLTAKLELSLLAIVGALSTCL